MQNLRITFGVNKGELFFTATEPLGEQAHKLLKGLQPDTDGLNTTLLERIQDLETPKGLIRVELPNENLVRTVHTKQSQPFPNVA